MHVIVATDGSKQSLAAAKHLKSFGDPTKITEISVIAVIRPAGRGRLRRRPLHHRPAQGRHRGR